MTSSVILIGMPGAGKSTVGVILAKNMGMGFLDTDIEIQNRAGKTLQQILSESDHMNLRHLEEQVLLSIDPTNKVVSTGGSAVYSEAGMAHLSEKGTIIYLQASLETLQSRIHNYDTRGIARKPDQDFQSLYDERTVLYSRYADITVDTDDFDADQMAGVLMARLANNDG